MTRWGEGKVAIVTGGSRGIGFQTARQLLEAGWRICITGRDREALDQALAGLGGSDGVFGVQGRAQDPDHQQQVVREVLARWSRIDGLVNNAATSPFLGELVEAKAEDLERGFAINVITPWSWIKQVYNAYFREHGGAVVNVASIGGVYPVPRVGAYNVTKAALIHMTRQLALEMAPKVRVNAVAPATIKTRFALAKYDGREREVADQYPLKRLGTPEEVAAVIASLFEEKFSWATGQVMVLDGGASLIQGVR